MLTREELITIENALGSSKAQLREIIENPSSDNKINMRVKSKYKFETKLLEKIGSMIDEDETEDAK